MAPEALNEVLHLRISAVEKQMLTELADRDGLKPSQFVRRWIRKAHESEFGVTPPKKKKR